MQSSKEQKGEKVFSTQSLAKSLNNAKKCRKTIEWETLESSSRKLERSGNFSCKDGHTKDRNGKILTETEEVKKRWQEYTKELCKKGLNDPDIHDGMITHLEPDIPKCGVKWALGSITANKASGSDDFQLS